MNKFLFAVVLLIFNLSISGCLTEKIDDEEIVKPEEYEYTDDGKLVIVTYDVYGLTDEMLEQFENQTGYEISLLKLDDSGSVLDHLLQHKGVQVADLAIGLDNTYLQTALDNNVLWEHNAALSNISDSALLPYNGPLAAPFDQGYICLNYDSEVVDGENYTIPNSLWELTNDEWKGKVAIPSPETSSPGRAFMTATTDYFSHDDDNSTDWTDWWSAMSSNEVIITTGWSEAYETRYTGGYGEWTDGHVGRLSSAGKRSY